MTYQYQRRMGDRVEPVSKVAFYLALLVGCWYAVIEGLLSTGWHLGDCVEHEHGFPWMTALTMIVFAAPHTLGPARVERLLEALMTRVRRKSAAVTPPPDEPAP